MAPDSLFARRAYRWAAIYGIPVLLFAYLQPVPDPWRLSHLGFVGIALVFQGVFLVIARDPRRYAPLMPVTVFEKLSFGIPAVAFYVRGQADIAAAAFGTIDLVLAAVFFVAWRKTAHLPG